MIDIKRALGIQEIFENKELSEELRTSILEEVRYVTPGYSCDYFLRTYNNEIEFELCKNLAGEVIGIDPHASGKNIYSLVYEDCLSDASTTHLYSVHDLKEEISFPVRVMCPDVLAGPNKGEIIKGQLIGFVDNKVSLSEIKVKEEFSALEGNDNSVRVVGKINNVKEYKFEFKHINVEYWDLEIETVIGDLTIVVRKDVIDIPEEDFYICAECMLSFDVAIEQQSGFDDAFKRNVYEHAAFTSEYQLGDGLYPSPKNAERVLQNCLKAEKYERFARACAEGVDIYENTKVKKIENAEVATFLATEIGEPEESQNVVSIVSCIDNGLLGQCAWGYVKDRVHKVLSIKTDQYGFVSKIYILAADECEFAEDMEIHALAMLRQGMEFGGSDILRDYLANRCIYRSEHADFMTIGASRIINHLRSVDEVLDDTNQYSYEIVPSSEMLSRNSDLPGIYQGKWCIKEYQGGELVSVIFVSLDELNNISNILLSRNGNYLKAFEKEGSSEAIIGAEVESVKSIIESLYGQDNPLQVMRENETPAEDNPAYVWKEADKYIKSYLRRADYEIKDTVIEDDCLGYSCTRKSKDYAVYVFAYGKQKTIKLDAEYCQKLKDYELSKEKTILLTYLQVESVKDDDGEVTYCVGKFNDSSSDPELWTLERVNGKDIILFYPREEVFEMVPRFMAAYNQQNLDLMKAIFSAGVSIDLPEGGRTLNDAVYSSLSHMHETKGKMKTAYIRYNDIVYSKVPYVEDCCYFSFSLDDTDRISGIEECSLDESYRDLIITEDYPEDVEENKYPLLSKVDFLEKSETARFAVRMEFDNGEIRRYNFEIDEQDEDDEDDPDIATIGRVVFTDKIFANGIVKEHIELPNWMGYRNYPERGQGIEFVNGYSISTAELYFNSYPVEEFNYSKILDVHISQFDYDEDGFGVGHIYDMDPENPYYLFDRNTMMAKKLPDKYQKTQMFIYPTCGGYSEGLIMVNPMGELELQYHHNRDGCAGMWGWINKDFEEVIPPQYIFAMNFENGKAIVCKGEWDKNEQNEYWCEHEKWGVITNDGNEIVPCAYDELYEVEGSDTLFFVHEGGWKEGHYSIYDTSEKKIILELDFDFDIGYMFNECFVSEKDCLVFVDHQPGEGLDYLYAYDLNKKEYIAYKSEYTERTLNGESRVVVNKDGKDIIVF